MAKSTRSKKQRIIRFSISGCLGLSLLGLIGIMYAYAHIDAYAEAKVYTATEDIPFRKVGLVLGCSKHLANGRLNRYFQYRIAAASELYQAGKITYILVSGDNSRDDYDESTDMMDALVECGVPRDHIVRDFAGFSTLDSVVRAKAVFLEEQLTVISQDFHVRRAIYIGAAHDVDLIGYVAEDVSGRGGLKTQMREYLARFKTVLDVSILDREPKFYGKTITIGCAISPLK